MNHSLLPNPTNLLPKLWTGKNVALVPKSGTQTSRRALIFSLSSITIGSLLVPHDANAAKKRGPSTITAERQDPNVGGAQAKAMASKKRREAMKEAMAKLREKGKITKE